MLQLTYHLFNIHLVIISSFFAFRAEGSNASDVPAQASKTSTRDVSSRTQSSCAAMSASMSCCFAQRSLTKGPKFSDAKTAST